MEKGKLITKKILSKTPIRIEYALTNKVSDLIPVLEQMAAFSLRFCCDVIMKDKKPRTLRQAFGIAPSIIK